MSSTQTYVTDLFGPEFNTRDKDELQSSEG